VGLSRRVRGRSRDTARRLRARRRGERLHRAVAHRSLTGILLAGGASTRFGSPKELAEYEGETLGDRAWRLLGEACDERIRVGPGSLDDPGTGPVAAIAAGLRAASHEIAVVIPVDLANLTA